MTTTEAVQDIGVLERFERDGVAAVRHGQSVTPVLRTHQIHPQTWADWRAIATGRMVRYRNGSQVSEYMREWCRLLEAKIADLQDQLASLTD